MKIVIIGNGIAGITAARHIRKRDAKVEILVISEESKYFFSRTAMMYVFMGHMKFEHTQPYENTFWKKNRIDLMQTKVQSIDFQSKTISTNEKIIIGYDKLIIATGSKPNLIPIDSIEAEGVHVFYSKNDLEKLEKSLKNIKNAVIVGGGLIGVEVAEMLHSRGVNVDFLVRESGFWRAILPAEESSMITKHIQNHNVNLKFETEIKSINSVNNKIESIKTSQNEEIKCEALIFCIGVQPNIEFLKNTEIKTERGILVDTFLQTNIHDVYAAGDCVQHINPPAGRRNIEQIWYSGRMMGEVVAANVLGHQTRYNPGVFFNSAKFFNIEYQTYGTVLSEEQVGVKSFCWKHPEKDLLLRLNYNSDNHDFLGLNAFGIRIRHEVISRWIEEKQKVNFVVSNLEKANFDPEFYKRYEAKIQENFNFF